MRTSIISIKSLFSFSIIAVLVLALSSCGSSKVVEVDEPSKSPKYAFEFMDSDKLGPILDLAAKEDKLVFVDIYASWCLPCKMMDRDVFTDQATADIINENFISYKVDGEKENGPDMALIFDVTQYPTLLFLDSKGRVLERAEGAIYHSQLIQMADSALEKVRISE